MSGSTEYFGYDEMGLDEETQAEILSPEEQQALVNEIANNVPNQPDRPPQNRVGMNSDVFTENERQHPFLMLQGIMRSLEALVTQARIPANAQDSDWVETELKSLKEMRMIMKDLMPVYEKYQTQLSLHEENWINNLVDFTFNWIYHQLGEEIAKQYMDAISELNEQEAEAGTQIVQVDK